MSEEIDYATPKTPAAAALADGLAFVLPRGSIFLQPRWVDTSEGARIAPTVTSGLAITMALVSVCLFFVGMFAVAWVMDPSPSAKRLAIVVVPAIGAITIACLATVLTVSRRVNRNALDWLRFDIATRTVALPAAGRTIDAADIETVELVIRRGRESVESELRVVLHGGECVGIVRSSRRSWAACLAGHLRAPLREITTRPRRPPTVWYTPFGGTRTQIEAGASA